MVALGIAVVVAIARLPPQHSPLAPLDLADPVGFATSLKLAQFRDDPPACRQMIARSLLRVTEIPDRRYGAFCELRGAVAIERSTTRYSAPVRVSCPMAAALYLWEREVVLPAAIRHLASRVVRIDHAGTYACRRVSGDAAGRPSEHATANAIDVTGFVFPDGRRVSVLAAWHGDRAERDFMREVRDGGCRLFRAVLSPDYNDAHRDHFHLDMGPYVLCR
jgi:hypothetical protein